MIISYLAKELYASSLLDNIRKSSKESKTKKIIHLRVYINMVTLPYIYCDILIL